MGFKITDYPAKTAFNDTDLYDCSTNATTSEKVTYSQLKTDLNANLSFLSSVPSGVLGIANTSGVYTYYSDFATANAAASSGDTIELFSDITESGAVTVTLKDGVKYNFNGHTYTCSDSAAQIAFAFATGTVYLFNGKILRTGGNTSSEALDVTSTGTVIGNNFQVENDNGKAATCNGGTLRNIDFINAGSGVCVQVDANGRIENCKAYSTTNFGIYVNDGIGVDCYGFSTVNYGISGGTGELINCTGESAGSAGLQTATVNQNCKGYSTGGSGIRIRANGDVLYNCSAYSIANHGIDNSGGKRFSMYNSTTHSTTNYGINNVAISNGGDFVWSNSSFTSDASFGILATISQVGKAIIDGCFIKSTAQDAMQLGGTNNELYITNNRFEVTAAGNFCIDGSTSAYITGNTFSKTSTTAIGSTTNLQVNTHDSFGNVKIG